MDEDVEVQASQGPVAPDIGAQCKSKMSKVLQDNVGEFCDHSGQVDSLQVFDISEACGNDPAVIEAACISLGMTTEKKEADTGAANATASAGALAGTDNAAAAPKRASAWTE